VQPLVSIVTPVYNGEQFLAECIESVLRQTYQNWDYTIVNNCSTDRTLEIAQRFASRDPRIRVHDNRDFLPMMRNLNNAFRQISPQAKYCKMILADDWIFPECLERMVALAEGNPSVAIVGAYGLDGRRLMWEGLPYPSPCVSGKALCRATFLGGPYVFGMPTSLLYRADVVRCRESFYDESNVHGDYLACLDVLQNADFAFVHQVLTFRRRRSESATSFSLDYNTYVLETLTALQRYGPAYLSPQELKRCLKAWRSEYYHFLAKSAFRLRERKFWDHHRNRLKELGTSLSWFRLSVAAMLEILTGLFHPRASLEAVWSSWRRRRPSGT